jgi:hypothetical protein
MEDLSLGRPLNTPIETNRWATIAPYTLLLIALVPIILVAQYVATQANIAPVGDQWWDVGYIAVKTRAGTLTGEDIFAYFLGHRPVIIRLMTVIFTTLTGYDVQILRFAAFATAVINLVLASLLMAHRHKRLLPFAVPLFALVLFTLYHEDSWLDYYFAVWQQPLFFLLIALLVIQRMRPGWLALILVILCAVATTFTLGLGIAAWFSLPIALLGKPAYRRWYYLVVWGVAFAAGMAFYMSDYAVSPYETEEASVSLQALLRDGLPLSLVYLIQFQSTRFDTDSISLFATALAFMGVVVMGINSWYIARREQQLETVAAWGSLALFPLFGAALTILGRGVAFPVPPRYSPGADGFWIAFVALALLALAYRPRPVLAATNVVLIGLTVVLTIQKDGWLLQRNNDPYPESCDQCVMDYPLERGDCFRVCFFYGEEQSVYHLAALRLSLFQNQTPHLVLPDAQSPVITDMPNRWLSVYVRDYLLAGVAEEDTYNIAPAQGTWNLPNLPYSPFYRGEWSTDILPQPLENVWDTADAFAADLPTLLADQPRFWYLNTPETEANLDRIEAAFTEADYHGRQIPIGDTRYASARFSIWCFEAIGSGACPADDAE